MDGSANGTEHDPLSGRFQPGNSEWRAKKRRLAERLAQLIAEYDTSPALLQVLTIAARHLEDAERGRTPLIRTRASNAARRLLADLPRKKKRAPALAGALTL